jgi:hypothetical protein
MRKWRLCGSCSNRRLCDDPQFGVSGGRTGHPESCRMARVPHGAEGWGVRSPIVLSSDTSQPRYLSTWWTNTHWCSAAGSNRPIVAGVGGRPLSSLPRFTLHSNFFSLIYHKEGVRRSPRSMKITFCNQAGTIRSFRCGIAMPC